MEQIEIRMPEYIQQNARTKTRPVKKVEIEVPEYSPQYGVWPILEEKYILDVQIDTDNTIVITADKGGLISLARHLLTLSQDEVPAGCHVHYDENILEDGSREFILCKV